MLFNNQIFLDLVIHNFVLTIFSFECFDNGFSHVQLVTCIVTNTFKTIRTLEIKRSIYHNKCAILFVFFIYTYEMQSSKTFSKNVFVIKLCKLIFSYDT